MSLEVIKKKDLVMGESVMNVTGKSFRIRRELPVGNQLRPIFSLNPAIMRGQRTQAIKLHTICLDWTPITV